MIDIIPAIDIIDGQCVRLTQGDFAQARSYANDPVETARMFEEAGIDRLHIVDLDGARAGRPVNTIVLEKIASATGLRIDFGGGLKQREDLLRVFESGAAMANLGSIAVRDPGLVGEWLDEFGPERIFVGADVNSGKLAVDAWQTRTEIEVADFLTAYAERGGRQAFVTDIAKDGALRGPATDLYRTITAAVPGLRLVASGGVASMADIPQLEAAGCTGVIIGKAFYEGLISIADMAAYLSGTTADAPGDKL